MPSKAPKQCNNPSCGRLTHNTYCPQHTQEDKRIGDRQYKRERTDKKEQQFYNSKAWKMLRSTQLSIQPLCEHCLEVGVLKPAYLIDHIKEIKDDWTLRLTLSNVQSLCQACHNKKTMKVARERNK